MFGKLLTYEQDGQTVTLRYEKQEVKVHVLTSEIINLFVPAAHPDHRSKAVEGEKEQTTPFTLAKEKDVLTLTTKNLICKIYDNFKVDFYGKSDPADPDSASPAQTPLCMDYRGERISRSQLSEEAMALVKQEGHAIDLPKAAGHPIQCVKQLDSGDCIYGLGDKTGVLNKRYYEYENWNSDIPDPHEDCFKSLYKSIPFFIVLKGQGVYGIFHDNTFRSYFDFGKENNNYYFWGSDDGNLDYYFIGGGSIPAIVRNYTYLTGRMPLPPRWALGYHQSRWGYDSEGVFRDLAKKFREYRIPCDALHFDIDYMERFKVFSWDKVRFDDPKKLLADLRKDGFKAITIIDPGVKVEDGYDMYEEGIKNDYFVKTPDGDTYVNAVWPGDAVFPDFGNPKVRSWWGRHLQFYVNLGVSGIWNDMNEPASFNGPLPDDIVFTDEDKPSTHRELHNVYGHNMAKATYEGFKALTGKRPFVITRACYSGSQKYTTAWTGDNQSLWTHLRMAIPQQCNLGLSGMAFVGTDIGGFGADTTPELIARWVEAGCFSPLFRNHCAQGCRNQEPWLFGEEVLDIYRKYVSLRYELIPYFYDLCRECEQTGLPILRPLVTHYEHDPAAKNLNDEFLVGEHLLVAPVVEQGAVKRIVYLPDGVWYDYQTLKKYEGGCYYLTDAPLDTCPIFVKAGTILPKFPAQMYVGEIADPPLILEVYPGEGSYVHYQDNGEDFAYREGAYNEYLFTKNAAGEIITTMQHEGYEKYPEIIIRRKNP